MENLAAYILWVRFLVCQRKKRGIEKKIRALCDQSKAELQTSDYGKERDKIYGKLSLILSDPARSEYYDYLNVIDSGFELLKIEDVSKEDIAWGKEFNELQKSLKAILRKNKRLGNPIRIKIENPYMMDDRLTWTNKQPSNRSPKSFENLLVKKMISPLARKIPQEDIAYIIHDIFEFFYGRGKGVEYLKKQISQFIGQK